MNASLFVGSMLIAAAFAEVAVRLIAPQQLILIRPDLWQPADTVGWLHRPDIAVRMNTGEGRVDVFTDSHGYRVGPDGPSSGVRNVLVLGDSFMEALQVQHEESFAALLEARLAQALGTTVAVRNAGVGGWGPEQYLLHAGHLLRDEDFDLVLTSVYLGNDIVAHRQAYFPPRAHAVRYRFRLPAGLSRVELVDALMRPLNDLLEVRSHLYIFLRTRLQSVRMRMGLAPLDFPSEFLKAHETAPDWSLTADILQDLDRVASRHGARSLAMLVPAPFQVDSASLRRYVSGYGLDPEAIELDQPNERLGMELAARGLQVVDPLATFRAAHHQGERLYGSVDPHLTSTGHALLADFVAPVAAHLLGRVATNPPAAQR